jgi:FtsZ-binding cell division protein ZapB
MDDGFELLEEKVRKAADTVKRLREEKLALERERNQLQHRLEEAEKGTVARAAPSAADARRIESLAEELKQMQREREQIKERIGSLLEVLEGLESL